MDPRKIVGVSAYRGLAESHRNLKSLSKPIALALDQHHGCG